MPDPISIETLRALLDYDPATGVLTYKARGIPSWDAVTAGKRAFVTDNGFGYLRGRLFKRSYMAHRVIWAMHYGEWPADQIDHVNGDRTDNRIANLRAASKTENRWNSTDRTRLHALPRGVSRQAGGDRQKPFMVKIQSGKRQIYLGHFATPEEAGDAYRQAAEEMHGSFAAHLSRED